MPRCESQTHDNCHVPLSEIQFLGTENQYIYRYNNHINKNYLKTENPTKISIEFCLIKGLKCLVENHSL